MADIIIAQKGGRRKVQAPRIDFTPMVDLGFILITFFIYTTTIAKPGSLEVQMPSDETTGGATIYNPESTITLIPVDAHKVAYYKGEFNAQKKPLTVHVEQVTGILAEMKQEVSALPLTLPKQAHQLHVVIKPNDNCKYEDVVHLIDDMNLAEVRYYAMVDISSEEKNLVEGAGK